MDKMSMSAAGGGTMASDRSDKLKQALWWAVGLAVLGLLAWGVSQIKLSGGGGHARQQTVKIMLPDAPPPPPPPKVEEKRPEPKQDNKPQPQQEQKQVQAPVAPAPMKMEGAAGNGESAFQAGAVTRDYKSGPAYTGPGGGAPSADERRKAMFYVNNIKRQLKDALERNLDTDVREVEVEFALWIGADGRISKFELTPSGNAKADADARHAFEAATKSLRLEKPGQIAQPLRMKLTLLPPGL